MRLLALVVVTGAMALFGACSSETTNEGTGTGGTDGGGGSATGGASTGGANTGGAATGGTNTGGAGTGGVAGSDGSTDGGLACPSGVKGAAMTAVGSGYCIDKTEVTNGEYSTFLQSIAGGDAAPSELTGLTACLGVTDYMPSSAASCPTFSFTADKQFPVRCVDWCSAYAYCKWAGKRLCGKTPSGDALPGQAKSTVNQWYMACAGPTQSDTFFYGAGHTDGRCVDKSIGTVKVVGSTLGVTDECSSFYYDGLTDMLGNVSEWEDACDLPQSASSDCNTRGGSAVTSGSAVDCGSASKQTRTGHFPDVGFRCCWDVSVN